MKRSRTVAAVLAWVAGFVLVSLLAGWLLLRMAQGALVSGAQRDAAEFVLRLQAGAPAIMGAIQAGRLDDAALEDLRRLRLLGPAEQFVLFDRQGRRIADSDSLDQPAAPADEAGRTHEAQSSARVREVLASRSPYTATMGSMLLDRGPVLSETYVPVVRDGQAVGVIELYTDQTARVVRVRSLLLQVLLMVGALLGAAAVAVWWLSRRGSRFEQGWQRALEHDPLTGLPNHKRYRALMDEAIERHRADTNVFALLVIDLDGFARVNDRLGHAGGDLVLHQCARRLAGVSPRRDLLGRLSGDRFALLMTHGADAAAVHAQGLRMIDALGETLGVGEDEIHVSACVGAARLGVDAQDSESLLHAASVALRRAKLAGPSRFAFYDPAHDRLLESRNCLAQELEHAIENNGLTLHYQPQYDARSGKLNGFEALVRWPHPERGLVPPEEFIALAEESRLIERLGLWVLHRACVDAAHWPKHLSVAVNLSAAQLYGNADLVHNVAQALALADIDASRLELELTESMLLREGERVQRTLATLSRMGVRLALDDFGTGYSSLAYLWRFPLHKVKIDRAFTRNLGTDRKVAVVVRAITVMAHSMGLVVNAEGVETPEQRAFLLALGCNELQGFMLGHPSPLDGLSFEDTQPSEPGELGAADWTQITTSRASL
jgi:diguanylate cyclase (GGDEF)-like protein